MKEYTHCYYCSSFKVVMCIVRFLLLFNIGGVKCIQYTIQVILQIDQ
jgi:hypothetical protein